MSQLTIDLLGIQGKSLDRACGYKVKWGHRVCGYTVDTQWIRSQIEGTGFGDTQWIRSGYKVRLKV